MLTTSSPELLISEVFSSIQGEGPLTGHPMTFIRVAGCKWSCSYCDTPYALAFEGTRMGVDQILEKVKTFPWNHVEVTGGEPLHHSSTIDLLTRLVKEGYSVSLETSGLNDISALPDKIRTIMDIKTPGSGMEQAFLPENLSFLGPGDAIKFVICNRKDFEWTLDIINRHGLLEISPVYLSPSYGEIEAATLADWITEQSLPVILNIQLHKLIWGEVRGR